MMQLVVFGVDDCSEATGVMAAVLWNSNVCRG